MVDVELEMEKQYLSWMCSKMLDRRFLIVVPIIATKGKAEKNCKCLLLNAWPKVNE